MPPRRRNPRRQAFKLAQRKSMSPLLPPCDGPKLGPYPIKNPIIVFDEILRVGSQSCLFKTKINGVVFALQVFRTWDIEDGDFLGLLRDKKESEALCHHIDPFFAECRANGRIAEHYSMSRSTSKEKIVPACYGYLYLTAEVENVIIEKLGHAGEEWERHGDGEQVRAIVKEYIETDKPIDLRLRSIRRMRDDLWTLQKIGVHPRIIYGRYYRGGLLVNLESSWTKPHHLTEILPHWQVEAESSSALIDFDEMVAELGFRTPARAAIPKRTIKTRSGSLEDGERYFI